MNARNDETGLRNNISGAQVHINGQRLPVNVFLFCLSIEVLLVLLDASINYAEWSQYATIRELFNIGDESSLASWFMVTQTFVAALILWVISLLYRDKTLGRARRAGWGFLACFFTYLAADDGAFIHERIGTVFNAAYGPGNNPYSDSLLTQVSTVFPSYAWQLVVLPLLAGAGVFMLFFLWREMQSKKERLLILCTATLMAIAVGLDFIEGLTVRHPWNLRVWFAGKFDIHLHAAAHYSKSLEEFLEMVAISILLALFLRHLIKLSGPGLLLAFHKKPASH